MLCLTKAYPGFTLEKLDLTLPGGCILGLIGENGAGKSTVIRLILGMCRREGGEITLLGGSPDDPAIKENLGVVLDQSGLPQSITPKQLGRICARIYRRWDDTQYAGFLRRLSLPEEKQIKSFSLGMRRKLDIAVALSHHPKLLLLDEATSGLDPVVREEILDLFYEFTRAKEETV